MVSINYSAREVCCKIVYYGPGLSGKTTNLQYVHAKVPGNTRGKLISLATEADRTLYFDFLPINIGTINGFAAKFQLYTVPGQVYYNATRKLVLRGVDGICFVADSQPAKMDENIESLTNLEENLREYGYDIADIPVVIQYNKRDLPGVLPVEELQKQLNTRNWPYFEASATVGNGVFDTLKMIIKVVLEKAKNTGSAGKPVADTVTPAPSPEPVAPPEEPLQQSPATDQPVHPADTFRQEARPPEDLNATPLTPPGVESNAAADTGPQQPVDPGLKSPEPPAEPEPVQYRPYPGSRSESAPAASSGTATATQEKQTPPDSQAASGQGSQGEKQESTSSNSGPKMAPSLRTKKEQKKRGFFKRLFGMK